MLLPSSHNILEHEHEHEHEQEFESILSNCKFYVGTETLLWPSTILFKGVVYNGSDPAISLINSLAPA